MVNPNDIYNNKMYVGMWESSFLVLQKVVKNFESFSSKCWSPCWISTFTAILAFPHTFGKIK